MIDIAIEKHLHTASGNMQLEVAARIEKGTFVSLYGVSGAGKTSILRMLAGFMKPDSGFIKVNQIPWFDADGGVNLVPQHRSIGFVFQDYALFPNMNVYENIRFALGREDDPRIVDELLELTGLSNFSGRKVQTLSGGQQQRVALARAIARKPVLLLLDEPLSAVDHAMRVQLQETLWKLHKRFELTTLLVSHDVEEITRLSDQVIHLDEGKIQGQMTPASFFQGRSKASKLAGRVISVEEDGGLIILIENRIWNVRANGQEFKVNDRIEMIDGASGFLIQKR